MAKAKGTAAIGTWPTPERVVRVRLPREVAYDLNKFVDVQKEILDRLGCGACCSGFDIRWDLAREFAVDDKLDVREVVSGVVVTDG
jgi:hypothetical protein